MSEMSAQGPTMRIIYVCIISETMRYVQFYKRNSETVTKIQVWLPTPMKASETGTGEKEKRFIQVLVTWEDGDSGCKAHLHLSVQAEFFIRKERKAEQGD